MQLLHKDTVSLLFWEWRASFLFYCPSMSVLLLFQNIRDILLVGHRQAVAWLDEWHGESGILSRCKISQIDGEIFRTWRSVCVCVCVLLLRAFPTGLSLEEVREYERKKQEETNCKVKSSQNSRGEAATPDLFCRNTEDGMKHIGGCESAVIILIFKYSTVGEIQARYFGIKNTSCDSTFTVHLNRHLVAI